jgi:signal transduction histidine kinase
MLLILMTIGIQSLSMRLREKRKRKIEMLKAEERFKIRQKTSEDFHDELGNKLTRISVLSDILESKNGHNADIKKIISQIKENVSGLYVGTKDILWALSPESDDLYEISKRLRDFGIELFQETPVSFHFEASCETFKDIKLASDYSRNITMIFKEAMNNILKHADSRNTSLQMKLLDQHKLIISLQDDGKGFDLQSIQKGHGITNMVMRADRINGELKMQSNYNQGTMISLEIKSLIVADRRAG